jgi:hypothetical protein
MTTETIPSAKNLEALGTEYLAEMLVQICTGDAELERRLVVLATTAAPRLAAREIRRRLDFIGRSRTYITSTRTGAMPSSPKSTTGGVRSANWPATIPARRSISCGNLPHWRIQ